MKILTVAIKNGKISSLIFSKPKLIFRVFVRMRISNCSSFFFGFQGFFIQILYAKYGVYIILCSWTCEPKFYFLASDCNFMHFQWMPKLKLMRAGNEAQAWVLFETDIGQCPAKNWVMFGKGCFAMDTAVPCEIKKNIYQLPTSKNSEAFGKHRPLLLSVSFTKILIDNLLMHISTIRCVWVKAFYTNTVLFLFVFWFFFFALFGTAAPVKTFYHL